MKGWIVSLLFWMATIPVIHSIGGRAGMWGFVAGFVSASMIAFWEAGGPAQADTRRMAETGTGSGRSPGGPVGGAADDAPDAPATD